MTRRSHDGKPWRKPSAKDPGGKRLEEKCPERGSVGTHWERWDVMTLGKEVGLVSLRSHIYKSFRKSQRLTG